MSLLATPPAPSHAAGVAGPTASASTDLSDCSQGLRRRLDKEEIPSRKPSLPAEFSLEVKASQAKKLFAIATYLYNQEFTGASLEDLIAAAKDASKDGEISEEQLNHSHDLRATLKQMRYLFIALGRDHECPEELDELATSLGKMRDHVQEDPELGRSSGERTRDALKRRARERIDRAIAKFRADDRAGFQRWLEEQIEKARTILAKPENTKKNPLVADDLHDLRKILQSILSVYFVRADSDPAFSRADTQVMKYLEYVTEDIGGEVVHYEETMAPKDLKSVPVTLAPRKRKAVTDFLEHLKL